MQQLIREPLYLLVTYSGLLILVAWKLGSPRLTFYIGFALGVLVIVVWYRFGVLIEGCGIPHVACGLFVACQVASLFRRNEIRKRNRKVQDSRDQSR